MSLYSFPVEEIPPTDDLYRRIPPDQMKFGKITSAAFEDFETSVDWCKYSTPRQTVGQRFFKYWWVGAVEAKVPINLGQEVIHDPQKNQAHTLIKGIKTMEVSERIAESCRIVYSPPQRPNSAHQK